MGQHWLCMIYGWFSHDTVHFDVICDVFYTTFQFKHTLSSFSPDNVECKYFIINMQLNSPLVQLTNYRHLCAIEMGRSLVQTLSIKLLMDKDCTSKYYLLCPLHEMAEGHIEFIQSVCVCLFSFVCPRIVSGP